MTNHSFLNLTEIREHKKIEMKQTPEKKEALTTNAFIPAGLQKKKDSFLGRDQENLDKFLQNNGWLVC